MSRRGRRDGERGEPPAGTRSAARRRALDILYEADVLGQGIAEVLARHLDQGERAGQPLEPYAVELASGVARRLADLDARIEAAAERWTIERMPVIDRNVLRLGTYELLAHPEVPTPVVIDEAVELAKLLSTAESGRYVNGVLAAIARAARPAGQA